MNDCGVDAGEIVTALNISRLLSSGRNKGRKLIVGGTDEHSNAVNKLLGMTNCKWVCSLMHEGGCQSSNEFHRLGNG